jgi:uncharacterized lipoprotein YddW (UPF0748 family)
VREYKLGIVKEIIENYDVDGIFLDWIRTGDIRDNPQTDAEGVADFGYEAPQIEGFKAKYGVDPHDLPNGDDRWVRFRAEPQTEFMRAVRTLVKAHNPRMPIAVMVAHPWDYRGMQDWIDGSLRGLLLDVGTWAREGLIDAAVPAGYYMRGGDVEKAYQSLRDETEGKVDIWVYEWVPSSIDDIEADVAVTQKLRAKQILFWEADYIDGRPNEEELQREMRKHAKM